MKYVLSSDVYYCKESEMYHCDTAYILQANETWGNLTEGQVLVVREIAVTKTNGLIEHTEKVACRHLDKYLKNTQVTA